MSTTPAVLLVLGEQDRNDTLTRELTLDGYETRWAGDPLALRARCTPGGLQLIILSPTTEQQAVSLDVVRALRAGELAPHVDPGMRVLWLAGTGELAEVLRAFDAGADDVMRTPFVHAELLARVRALLRRDVSDLVEQDGVIDRGALQIDTVTRTVTFGLIPVDLRRLEYELLLHLARDPHRVYTKQELLMNVWGFRSQGTTRTVDSHASRLRRKLALAGAEGWITSVWGVGLRLAPDAPCELRLLSGGRSA
jgi:DNA-binding response OmpR family regulator